MARRLASPLPDAALTIAMMPARIASGSSGQVATTTAKSGSVLQVSVGKWWATDSRASRKLSPGLDFALRWRRFAKPLRKGLARPPKMGKTGDLRPLLASWRRHHIEHADIPGSLFIPVNSA